MYLMSPAALYTYETKIQIEVMLSFGIFLCVGRNSICHLIAVK